MGPRNKAEFYQGWKALRFGNRVRMWAGQEELAASDYGGTVSARSTVAGGLCVYGVPAEVATSSLVYAGMAFNESAPDAHLLLQGELCHDSRLGGYYLFASAEKLPMRKALASSGQHHRGLGALLLLRAVCNPKGFDMLMELLDLYPDAVIEFGAYSRNLGEIPGHNTVVWEVREY